MMTNTAGRRPNSAMDEQNAYEDDVRSLRHLSDDELRGQLADTLEKEKAVIDRWISSGDCFILSATGKVHLPSCSSVSAVIDREEAWAPYLDDLERVRDWQGSDNAPPMPALLTRFDVEDLTRYTACAVCAPVLDHSDKRPAASGWTALAAGSLNFKHFGTVFSLAGGAEIGTLTRISRVETADGLEFAAEFAGLADSVTDPLTELMHRSDTAAEAS